VINKQRCGPAKGASAAKKGPSKAGNGVAKKGDKHGMEYRPVKKDPEWDGASKVAKWS
jgi:hypothetical protein